MKKLNLTKVLLLTLFPLLVFGQNLSSKNGFFELNKEVNHADGFLGLKGELNIESSNSLVVLKKSKNSSIQHTRFNQYALGYRIVGASFVVHEKADAVNVNGDWVQGFSNTSEPALLKEEAINIALSNIDANKYYWESNGVEKQLKRSKGADATYYPKPVLVWYDKSMSKKAEDYRLAYEMDVHVLSPRAKYCVYIDALTGELIDKYNKLHSFNTPGHGESYFHGDVDFVVDSLSENDFALDESLRHGHSNITTYDFNDDDPEIIHDSNNIWGEDDELNDRGAIEGHWSAEKTVDYFHEYHERMGMDDNGKDVIVNVHVADFLTGGPMANAFYDGESLNFGDGNDLVPHPFTLLGITAHEFVHGVTESEASLTYSGESGGINESMSDIFSVAVEHYMTGEYNWEVGEELDYIIRKMHDPKSLEMPSTYGGEYWDPTGDVHVSSAIGNLWFHLLVEGGIGTNDNDNAFYVDPLGFDIATNIVYEALTNYLTEDSNYEDFRNVTLEIAENLYGLCSYEYSVISEAWYAVGVGDRLFNTDFQAGPIISIESSCVLGLEEVEFAYFYNTCLDVLPLGSEINMHYSINGQDTVSEVFISTLDGPQIANYTFLTLADLSEVDVYEIKIWIDYEGDGFEFNNTYTNIIENRLVQNEDFASIEILDYTPGLCGNIIPGVNLELQYLGCDDLIQGQEIPVDVILNGDSPITVIYETEEVLSYGDVFYVTVESEFTLIEGENVMTAEVKFPEDPFVANNITTLLFALPESINDQNVITFENEIDLEQFHFSAESLVLDEDFAITLIPRFDIEGNDAMFLSGGDLQTIDFEIEEPSSLDNVWDVNQGFIRRTSLCVDASAWDEVHFGFDLRMQSADFFYNLISLDATHYCNLRIRVNGEIVSPTYHVDLSDDSFRDIQLDLSVYAGTSFNITFESQNVFPISFASALGATNGDDITLDNIWIGPNEIVSTKTPINNKLNLQVFPNPTSEYIDVQLDIKTNQKLHYFLYDINGRMILNEEIENALPNQSFRINTESLSSGVYSLKVLTNDGYVIKSIVKTSVDN